MHEFHSHRSHCLAWSIVSLLPQAVLAAPGEVWLERTFDDRA